MELRRERFTAEWLDPRREFAPSRAAAEVRWDTLTGQSCRLLREPHRAARRRHRLFLAKPS
jgi:hypothetical protein